ncbi:F-box protein [Ceratobasidium sp. AG-Ba]|nr:F-box protein [Ceratobasidium sp. AG-Ba]
MSLLDLPDETLLHILCRTKPASIAKCRQVCRFLWKLIDASAELHYLIELERLGYVPPAQPRLDLTYNEKIELLRTHKSNWDSISTIKPTRYRLQTSSVGFTSTYDFYGGVYARGSTLNSLGSATRRMELYQLASVNKGTEYKQWVHEDIGVDTRDFAMEPDFDLLVLLELSEQKPIIGATTQGAPNIQQFFNVHLRSLRTCGPHPDATRPIINHSLCTFGRTSWSFYFQIVGKYLAVMFLTGIDQQDENHTSQLRVWDWTTGNEVTYVDIVSAQSRSFAFLSDQLIVLPRQVANTGRSRSNTARGLGMLNLFTFDPPNGSSPAPHARHIATLGLPPLPDDVMSISNLSCRSDPAPSPSTQSASWDRRRPRLFELAPTNRILCLRTELTVIDTTRGQFAISDGTLFVPFMDILDAAAHLYKQSEPTEIPWDDWAQKTTWLDTSELHTGNECYVFGQRVVTTGLDTSNQDNDGEEDDIPQRRSIAMLDFEPARLSLRTELLDPQHEAILADLSDHDILWQTFLGEGVERKANTPLAIQTSRIRQRLTSAFYVMIDDEHIVLVLSRLGVESQLLVYSF